MSDWYATMWPVCEKLLARTDMQTVVAYEKRDPSFLYGFIAADPTEQAIADKEGAVRWWPALVLYVFIKQNYRGHGYARGLFAAAGIDPSKPFLYASNSQQASRLSTKFPLARFNPLA
jgi:GNAT superfamily N-acetyltransferase